MAFEIRQISLTADGREIVRTRTVEKDQISIGRAAERDIHLQDLAVTPDHARIENLDGRRITVRAVGTLGFEIDGRSSTHADVDSATGAELRFGGHRITISRGDEGQVVLSIQRVEAVSDASEEKEEAEVFSLRGSLPGKRVMSWIGVIAVLIAFLAVPVMSFANRTDKDTRNIYELKGDQVKGDGAWTPGALSTAHHQLETKCEACHQKAFVSVRDNACKTCHQSVHDHAPAGRLGMARAEPGFGGKILSSFRHAFGKEPEGACVDCHREHEGAGQMQATQQVFCTDCHATLKSRLKDTKLGDAGNFGTDHPEFMPRVMLMPGDKPTYKRVSLDSHPLDKSGLKFPHDIHLSSTNGVARMAQTMKTQYGFGNALVCKDCHTPTADGVRFLPVNMEKNCQMCHSLAFETIGGTVRTLRHGEPDQVIADLRAFYRSTPPARPISLGGMARRQPGDYAQGKTAMNYAWAASARPASAEAAIAKVFSKGGACYDCHTITPPGANGTKNWSVVPVHQTMRYMMNGWFDHDAHKTEKCESCHAADKSKDAAQLMLPGISVCRDCHGGEKAKKEIPSGCALCHSYHKDEGAPWVPVGRIAREQRDSSLVPTPAQGGAR